MKTYKRKLTLRGVVWIAYVLLLAAFTAYLITT
jgi:hypothetical protein